MLAHPGHLMNENFKEAAMTDPRYQKKANVKSLAEFEINPNIECILMLESGKVFMK